MANHDNSEQDNNSANDGSINSSDIKTDNTEKSDENAGIKEPVDLAKELEAKTNELNDKYLRLYSEFDNYRKRTIKEKSDIIKTAGEDVFKAMLPIIDDFERAMKASEGIDDINALKEGVQLIYNKLKNSVQQKGLISFDSVGNTFDPETMEAITHIPAADESQKGKVVDEVEKGYMLGNKVIRFARVVVAQ